MISISLYVVALKLFDLAGKETDFLVRPYPARLGARNAGRPTIPRQRRRIDFLLSGAGCFAVADDLRKLLTHLEGTKPSRAEARPAGD